MIAGKRLYLLGLSLSSLFFAVAYAGIQESHEHCEFVLLDHARITQQYEQWQVFFGDQKCKRMLVAGAIGITASALLGYYFFGSASTNVKSAEEASSVVMRRDVETVLWQNFLEEREKHKTWHGRLGMDISAGFDRAVVLAIAGFCTMLVARAGNITWNHIQEKFGFGVDTVLKSLIFNYGLDSQRLMSSLLFFFKNSLVDHKDDPLAARLMQQCLYGVKMDQRAFVHTAERCVGLIMYYIKSDVIGGTEQVDIAKSLEKFIDLVNDVVQRQGAVVVAVQEGNKQAQIESCMALMQGIQEEGLRLMSRVGIEVYGNEFNVQTTCAA